MWVCECDHTEHDLTRAPHEVEEQLQYLLTYNTIEGMVEGAKKGAQHRKKETVFHDWLVNLKGEGICQKDGREHKCS